MAKKDTTETAAKAEAKTSEFSVDDLRAQSVVQATSFIELMEATERAVIGTWFGVPNKMGDWFFIRCGLKGATHAEDLARKLRAQGYVEAPPTVKLAGFESDGDRALYLCAPPETMARLRAQRAKAARARDQAMRDQFGQDVEDLRRILHGKGTVEIRGETGTGGDGDFQQAIRNLR